MTCSIIRLMNFLFWFWEVYLEMFDYIHFEKMSIVNLKTSNIKCQFARISILDQKMIDNRSPRADDERQSDQLYRAPLMVFFSWE